MNISVTLRGLATLLIAASSLASTAQSVEGTSYTLPKTVLRITVKTEKATYTPGRFAAYAQQYLRKPVGQQSAVSHRILGIDISTEAQPDTARHYTLVTDKRHSISNVARAAGGQLLAINAEATMPETSAPTFTPAPKPAAVNPNDYMSQEILSAGSQTKMAELTAREIYDIRDSRNQLNRGEADFMPKDGAQLRIMLDNLGKQEQALASLFEGTTERDTTWTTLYYTPQKEGRDVLFRFSSLLGLLEDDDYAGEPFYITIADQHTATEPAPGDPKKEDKNDIGLRVALPTQIKATVASTTQQLATITTAAPQMGFVESLSGELFGKKQSTRIILDPMTGAVVKIEAYAPEQ